MRLEQWIRARGGTVTPKDLVIGGRAKGTADAREQLDRLVREKRGRWTALKGKEVFSLFSPGC